MKWFLRSVVLVVVCAFYSVGLVGAQGPTAVNIAERDFHIDLAQTTLPAGTPLTFTITNNGPSTHELVLERAGAVDQALVIGGTKLEAPDILPGTTRTVTWTVPSAGNYQVACHISGHYEAGMKVLFTANMASGAVSPLPATGGQDHPLPLVLAGLALVILTSGAALRKRLA